MVAPQIKYTWILQPNDVTANSLVKYRPMLYQPFPPLASQLTCMRQFSLQHFHGQPRSRRKEGWRERGRRGRRGEEAMTGSKRIRGGGGKNWLDTKGEEGDGMRK